MSRHLWFAARNLAFVAASSACQVREKAEPRTRQTLAPSSASGQVALGLGLARGSSATFKVVRTLPAVTRGDPFFGIAERFNRYYSDPAYQPQRTLYVSADGTGDGITAVQPTTVDSALSQVKPGDLVQFGPGSYQACWQINKERSGTYNLPVVLKGSVDGEGHLITLLNCCETGRRSCFNLEYSSYVAIDSFEFLGGKHGVRAAAGLTSATHALGNAVLNSYGHDNAADPFFTGGNDWFVIEGSRAERAGTEDGHGIYLSNGSDFNIVRYNEVNDNHGSDFQINADPLLTCKKLGIEYTDPQCDGDAKSGLGNGASDYFLVENSYFHNGRAQGANFTSVRHSIVRNNTFAFYQRHGVSFWQETDNPALGSSHNSICHNLFIGSNHRELVQFIRHSDHNSVRNNLFVGVVIAGSRVSLNSNTPLLAASDTVTHSVWAGNMFVGGMQVRMSDSYELLGARHADAGDLLVDDFKTEWFSNFPLDRLGSAESYQPSVTAPWAGHGAVLEGCDVDFRGSKRTNPTALGPWAGPN